MRVFLVMMLVCASAASAAEPLGIEFETVQLPIGLTLYVAEDHFQPLVTLGAVVAAGGRHDPPRGPDISWFVERGIRRGIPGLEGYALDGRIDRLGAQFQSGSNRDAVFLFGQAITANWRESLRVFSEMLMNPTFPKQEVSLLKKQRIAEWKAVPENPSALGHAHLMNALYGGAYAPCEAERTASTVSGKDLVRFHRKYFRPNRTTIVVIGDFKASDAIAALREAFEKWPHGEEKIEPAKARAPVANPPRARLVHKPGLTQATVVWGLHSISQADTNSFALLVADWVLGGGGFSSRLTTRLRSEGGRTYSIGSFHQGSSDDGQYGITISTRNEGLTATIDTIRAVTVELVRGGMTQEEFEKASGSILGSFPIGLETPAQIAWRLMGYIAQGLSLNDFLSIPSAYQAVTIEKANRVASQVVRPDEMIWVVVGDKSQIGGDLKAHFGELQTVDYREGIPGGNFIRSARPGVGGTWNSIAGGPRLSILTRRVYLSGTYGFVNSSDAFDSERAWQATLDLHKGKSECSQGSLFIGATGTFAGDVMGVSPHIGFRIFPYAVRYHYSIATDVGWSFWDEGGGDQNLPGFHWSIGLDYFF